MRKRNNRGFAISTILYGLVIMAMLIVALLMSLMSSNRRNTSGFVDSIEEELNRYSQTSTDFTNSGSTEIGDGQEYIVPYGKSGWYKIQLWGASGGGNGSNTGGLGSYTSGIIYLEENDHLYCYSGGSTSTAEGGFNGGGTSGGNYNARGGGGATDVRLVSGDWNDATSLNSRIMVAAGGGGSDSYSSGSNGADGGTLVGNSGGSASSATPGTYTVATGGGQMLGGVGGTGLTKNNDGSFGIGGSYSANNHGGGGGSGYYGGGCGSYNDGIVGSGASGSSYISGYAGISSITSEADRTTTNQTIHYSGKYFINGLMIPGVNSGAGKAKIELVSENNLDNPPTRKNSKLTNVRYIRDCINGNTVNAFNHWLELQAIVKGNNILKGKTDSSASNPSYMSDGIIENKALYSSKTEGSQCITIDLGSIQTLDEIAVWHYFDDSRQYYDHKLEVSADNATWTTIKNTSSENAAGTTARASERETANGSHYSAWQPDSTSEIPEGNYYIFSSLSENRVLTAQDSKILASGNANVTLELFDASQLQKWTVKKVDDTYYSIIEAENSHSLQVSDGTGDPNVNVNAATTYGGRDWELWKIIPLGNGNYRLQPKTSVADNTESYLSTSENSFNTSSNILLRQKNYELSQRFRFVNAEF